MNNGFSFTLIESSDNITQVIFLAENSEVIHDIFDSYDFNITEHSDKCFFVDESIEDVFDELNTYEIDEENDPILLTEEDEGFYITPLDDIYEIEYITADPSFLLEGPAKRKMVIRGGKRKIIFKCGPGQMKVGKSCRRRPAGLLNKMKRRAKITARKSRKKRRMSARKRKISMRRRAMMVHKTVKHKVLPPSKPKHYKPKH